MEEQNLLSSLKNKNTRKNKLAFEGNKIWSQNIGNNPTNLPSAINIRKKKTSALTGILYSDNKAIFLNDPVKKRRQIDKNKTIKLYEYIEDKTEKLLTKVYDKINFMKNEDKELKKLNSLGFQKTSKCFFLTNRPKTSKININSFTESNTKTQDSFLLKPFSKKNTNNLKSLSFNKSEEKNTFDNKLLNSRNLEINNIYTNENTKEETFLIRNSSSKKRKLSSALNKAKKSNLSTYNNQSKYAKSTTNKKIFFPIDLYENKGEEKFRNLINVDIEKLYSTNKQKKLNLGRINEFYRIQMNKVLKKYNPENHLKELNKIQLNNIKVRKEMENVKGKINKKLRDRSQGQYFKKEYLKFKEENEKDKKRRAQEKKQIPKLIPFNIVFEGYKNLEDIPFGYKKRAYYDYCMSCERIQKTKNYDLMDFGADLLFGHINSKDHELLYDSLDVLFNALEIGPIDKYIEDMKNQEVNRNKDVLNERIKKYFPVFTETEKILQQTEKRKITKTKKLDENIDILEKINETKKLIKLAEKDKHIPYINDN